ncbi:MAG: lipopolysaccharide biosynthesis protein, partial [Solirubrobacterales bacterium]
MGNGFVKDMVKYLPSQIVPGLVGLVSIPVVTHIFPPQEYGDYSLAAATVMILTTCFGWLPTSVIRYYPAYERDGRLAAFHATILRLAAITITGVTLLYYAFLMCTRRWMSDGLWRLLMIGGFLFAATCAFNLLQYVLRSKGAAGRFSAFAVWYSAAGFGLGIALILLLGLGIEGLL